MEGVRLSRVLIGGVVLCAVLVVPLSNITSAGGKAPQPSPGLLPDVIEEVPTHLQIQNTQQREFLRFPRFTSTSARGTSRSVAAGRSHRAPSTASRTINA